MALPTTGGSADDRAAWDRSARSYASLTGGPDDSFRRRFEPFLARWLPPAGAPLCVRMAP